jgi:SAM-dependent methyltransferase
VPQTQPQPAASAGAEAHCRWCGAGFDDRATPLPGRVRCGHCGVATTDPWPAPEELEAAYGEWYRPPSGRFSGPGDRVLRRSRASLAARVDRLAPPGRVLDVGSGDGSLVRALRGHGRDAEGIERGDRGLEGRPGPYAAIVFWHSLEHLPDPPRALAHAAGALHRGGLLVVSAPNAESVQARWFGDRWFGLDLPRHLVHLTAQSLARRCEELGCQVTRISFWRGGQVLFGWLHGLVGRSGLDLYDAIRRPEARRRPLSERDRRRALVLAVAWTPVASVLSAVEMASGRAGTFVLEAVRV